MAKRRTASSAKDIIGNTVEPGNIVAIAVSQVYGASKSELKLVEIDKIYLDDSRGEPYFEGIIYFRDRTTGLFYEVPTDETRPGWGKGTVPVTPWNPDLSQYVPIKPKKPLLGHNYTGSNEIVVSQSARIYGQPLRTDGTPGGKKAYYELKRIILVHSTGTPLTKEELAGR